MTGAELKKVRLGRGYTQATFAEEISVTVTHVSRMECGRSDVPEWLVKYIELTKYSKNKKA